MLSPSKHVLSLSKGTSAEKINSPDERRDQQQFEPAVASRAGGAPARRLALVDVDGRAVQYGDLEASAEAVARRLRAAGCGPRARIAVLMHPCRRFIEILHAAQQLGAVLVPLNDRLHADELTVQILNADPAWLLYDDAHAEPAHALCTRVPTLRPVSAEHDLDRLPGGRSPSRPHRSAGAALDHLHVGHHGRLEGRDADQRQSLGQRDRLDAAVRLGPGRRVALPDAAVPRRRAVDSATRRNPWLRGDPRGPVDADAVNRMLRTQRVTLLSLVPTMLVRLLDVAGAAPFPPGLRCALIGGGVCPTELIARARGSGIPAVPTYGMTEAASQICTADADDVATAPGSVGRPLGGLDLRVLDADAAGWGQIAVRGPQITAGYFRNADATTFAIDGEWLHTGDIGRLDTAGRVWVVGRGTDLIVTGGEKVVPDEIEAVLADHPSVQDAAVYGVSDSLWGQRVAAAVVLRPGAVLDAADLQAWCRRRLARFKVPRHIEAVAALPRTASGKLQRHLVQP